jgi:hypothetical protein
MRRNLAVMQGFLLPFLWDMSSETILSSGEMEQSYLWVELQIGS